MYIFLADVILGREPWLNSTTACTFPEPFHDNGIIPPNVQMDDSARDFVPPANHKPDPKLLPKKKPTSKQFKQNEGLFGNFAYGNISVSIHVIFSSQTHSKLSLYY